MKYIKCFEDYTENKHIIDTIYNGKLDDLDKKFIEIIKKGNEYLNESVNTLVDNHLEYYYGQDDKYIKQSVDNNPLNNIEHIAILFYANIGYEIINRYLQGKEICLDGDFNNISMEDVDVIVKEFEKAVKKCPKLKNKSCYRMLNDYNIIYYNKGDKFTIDKFWSFSTEEDNDYFENSLDAYDDGGLAMVKLINTKNVYDISDYTNRLNEYECVCLPGTKFKLVDVTEDDKWEDLYIIKEI